ncbi:MAG: hypothetical protein MUD12_08570 [Spirochaetes bacterium]|nr:hypothetical protein [Spirochaetota bacterium]
MPNNDDFDFESIFDEQPVKKPDSFEMDDAFIDKELPSFEELSHVEKAHGESTPSSKKRSSDDFEPDMDAILLTAQSPMINEAMKYLTMKDYTLKALPVFHEALKGIELYIKILERNPQGYFALAETIANDIDCKEVERISFSLYKTRFNDEPISDSQRITAFELFRERIRIGLSKSMINKCMVDMKKYFLMSGMLDDDKMSSLIENDDQELKQFLSSLIQNLRNAMRLIKTGNIEINKNMKGRDLNNFMIKATELLSGYYHKKGNTGAEVHYKKMNENYTKYFIVK